MGRMDASRIEQFLRDASSLAGSSFEDHTGRKKEILRAYFGRFQEGAAQDIDRYNSVQVGAIFSRLVTSYRKGRS
ncbi:MAG: hypothetical protein MUF61_03290 [archaeon]|nr:hypothetical protein [archaeon]